MSWGARVVCLLFLLVFCGVTPVRALSILNNDSNLTYDERTGYIWLDFSVSQGKALTAAGRLPGYDDFQLASKADVIQLMTYKVGEDTFIPFTTCPEGWFYEDYASVNGAIVERLYSFMVASSSYNGTSKHVMFAKLTDSTSYIAFYPGYQKAGIEFIYPVSFLSDQYASWLVYKPTVGMNSAPVPEPTTFMLLLAGLTGLAAMTWRQRRHRGH